MVADHTQATTANVELLREVATNAAVPGELCTVDQREPLRSLKGGALTGPLSGSLVAMTFDDELDGAQPRCPACGVLMRDEPGAFRCPACGTVEHIFGGTRRGR